MRTTAKTAAGNDITAHELGLYAVNTGDLYKRLAAPLIANLARKIVAGKYDEAKAPAAWRYYMTEAAKSYSREFSTGDDWATMFPPATRAIAVAYVMEHYSDELRDTAELLKKDRENRKYWKLADIKHENDRRGGYFFSRKTMQFFGDTMRNFAVRYEGGNIFVERIAGRMNIGTRWRFNPETGDLT